MPVITVKYDDAVVQDSDASSLSEAVQKIVSEVTGIEDVFVYADSPKIKVKVAPIEIFVEITGSKIASKEEMLEQIRSRLAEWKKGGFNHPINVTLAAMDWKFVLGI